MLRILNRFLDNNRLNPEFNNVFCSHFSKTKFELPLKISLIIVFIFREEEERLRNKIRADHEKALEEAKEKLKKSRDEIQAEIQTEKNNIVKSLKSKSSNPLPPVPVPNLVGINSGDPVDPDIREKRDKIKEVISYANGYLLIFIDMRSMAFGIFVI